MAKPHKRLGDMLIEANVITPQDLLDAEQALHSSDAHLDLDLLRRVTRRFGRAATDMLERLLAT